MKRVIIIFFLITISFVYGQSDFKSLLENVKTLKVPYTSEYNNDISNNRKVLTQNDSIYLISKLVSTKPTLVNDIISSPFAEFDCRDVEECLNLENIEEIAIIGFIKVDSNNYMLHILINPKGLESSFGILMSIKDNGELMDWFISNNSTWGNPNGQLSRDFKIDENFTLTVSESSWGRNNIHYFLEAEFRVFRFDRYEDSGNNKDEHNDYDYSLENKIEHFDLKEGKFELTKICLNI
ncbi:MAG: hypothetical protein Kapaf2KO_02050 [Candidatus Kapaibacteriales bacterium]